MELIGMLATAGAAIFLAVCVVMGAIHATKAMERADDAAQCAEEILRRMKGGDLL